MGDELKKNLGVDIELVAGANGIFDVTVDGKLIFSKFPKTPKNSRYDPLSSKLQNPNKNITSKYVDVPKSWEQF